MTNRQKIVHEDIPDNYWDEIVDLDQLSFAVLEQIGKEQKRIAAKWASEKIEFPYWLPEPDDIEKYKAAILAAYASPHDNNDFHKELNSAQFRYEQGLKYGREEYEIHIGFTGAWTACQPWKGGRGIGTYERLGHDAHTADLLRGWFDSGAKIIDHRREGPYYTCQCGYKGNLEKWANNEDKCPTCGRDPQPWL